MTPFLWGSAALHGAAGASALAGFDWRIGLAAVAANHAAITAAGLWPRSNWLGPNVTRLPADPTRAPSVAISLDDGPDPEITPILLDLLAAHQVQATFFCIGQRVLAHPALARRIVSAGHHLQNHSLSHTHTFSILGPKRMQAEIARAQEAIFDTVGQRPTLFRAPAGLRNPFLQPILERLDLRLTAWTRRGFDTREGDPARVLRRLVQGLAADDIVLLHDGHSARAPSGEAVSQIVLTAFLAQCGEQGLKSVRIADCFEPTRARPAPARP